MLKISRLDYGSRFQSDFKRLDSANQQATCDCLNALLKSPLPKALRHHTLGGYKPKIHKVDVSANCAYQVTFEVEGDTAKLLRVATHKQIDRTPR